MAYRDVVLNQVRATTGVSGVPVPMISTSAAEMHQHDQVRSGPLPTIDGMAMIATLVIYAAARFAPQWIGCWSEPSSTSARGP